MSAPLSNELFFEAHRGLHSDKPVGQNLGMHWSADKGVAEMFSRGLGHRPVETVVSAKIPLSSVETNTTTLKNRRAILPDSNGKNIYAHEQEIPVKADTPVFVDSISRRGNASRKRGESLNEKFHQKVEQEGEQSPNAWKLHEEATKHFARDYKRNRRITTRFNPPKEMTA